MGAADRTSRACSEAEEISLLALDSDPQRVREAAADGGSVVYGDAGRREALMAAGLSKARAVVVTFADTPTALRILHHVHEARPELPVIVRTLDDTELDQLLKAGAAEVVPEVLDGQPDARVALAAPGRGAARTACCCASGRSARSVIASSAVSSTVRPTPPTRRKTFSHACTRC